MWLLPSNGDLCWREGQVVKRHYGVCHVAPDGQRWFVETTAGKGVRWATWAEFSLGKPVYVELAATPGEGDVVVTRAAAELGRPYDLFQANCEHLARGAATGVRESPQLQKAFLGAALAAGVAYLLNENGTSVDPNGYRRDSNGRFGKRRIG